MQAHTPIIPNSHLCHDNLGFIHEGHFCGAFARSPREREPSGIAAVADYLDTRGTMSGQESTRCTPPLPLLQCFLLCDLCVGSLASPGSLSFCFLYGDGIRSPRVMRPFASATYQPWSLSCRHDVIQNQRHVLTVYKWHMSPQLALPGMSLPAPCCSHKRIGTLGKAIYCLLNPPRTYFTRTFSFLVLWNDVKTRKSILCGNMFSRKKYISPIEAFTGLWISIVFM